MTAATAPERRLLVHLVIVLTRIVRTHVVWTLVAWTLIAWTLGPAMKIVEVDAPSPGSACEPCEVLNIPIELLHDGG
jgi:hypothetical protein